MAAVWRMNMCWLRIMYRVNIDSNVAIAILKIRTPLHLHHANTLLSRCRVFFVTLGIFVITFNQEVRAVSSATVIYIPRVASSTSKLYLWVWLKKKRVWRIWSYCFSCDNEDTITVLLLLIKYIVIYGCFVFDTSFAKKLGSGSTNDNPLNQQSSGSERDAERESILMKLRLKKKEEASQKGDVLRKKKIFLNKPKLSSLEQKLSHVLVCCFVLGKVP